MDNLTLTLLYYGHTEVNTFHLKILAFWQISFVSRIRIQADI